MRLWRKKAFLATLLAGAWLPATISCDPGNFDGVIHVWGDDGIIVVEDGCHECWFGFGECCDDGFDFDFFYDD